MLFCNTMLSGLCEGQANLTGLRYVSTLNCGNDEKWTAEDEKKARATLISHVCAVFPISLIDLKDPPNQYFNYLHRATQTSRQHTTCVCVCVDKKESHF